eukprot:3814799-Rhodomonas_salina.1
MVLLLEKQGSSGGSPESRASSVHASEPSSEAAGSHSNTRTVSYQSSVATARKLTETELALTGLSVPASADTLIVPSAPFSVSAPSQSCAAGGAAPDARHSARKPAAARRRLTCSRLAFATNTPSDSSIWTQSELENIVHSSTTSPASPSVLASVTSSSIWAAPLGATSHAHVFPWSARSTPLHPVMSLKAAQSSGVEASGPVYVTLMLWPCTPIPATSTACEPPTKSTSAQRSCPQPLGSSSATAAPTERRKPWVDGGAAAQKRYRPCSSTAIDPSTAHAVCSSAHLSPLAASQLAVDDSSASPAVSSTLLFHFSPADIIASRDRGRRSLAGAHANVTSQNDSACGDAGAVLTGASNARTGLSGGGERVASDLRWVSGPE